MITTLHKLQSELTRLYAADSSRLPQVLQQVVALCQANRQEAVKAHKKYRNEKRATTAFRQYHRLLITICDRLYRHTTHVDPIHPEALSALASLLQEQELLFKEYIDPDAKLPLHYQAQLSDQLQQQLPVILTQLGAKGIPSAYLLEIKAAMDSLFQKGKLPDLRFYHYDYLPTLVKALQELANDRRAKKWTERFILQLIAHNFNHMGFYNRWCEQVDQIVSQMEPFASQKYLLSLRIHLRRDDHAFKSAYNRERASLLSYMRDYVENKLKDIKSANWDKIDGVITGLNSQQLAVIFHYIYDSDMLLYPSKRIAAAAFSTHIKSKTGNHISIKTLLKIDKREFLGAAAIIYKKFQHMAIKIKKDYDL
ncbi:hypothetical protein [Sphingobacterium sp. SYP-B4668]|uniref:hypothetical protein n=1 Tax=Sphingobacterium sp. SYP-B4668 TaxID=2996035 RepID=UPI0022DD4D7D|nr:hypothetical protein [Sphingobacterium sp. SYP-B4668]